MRFSVIGGVKDPEARAALWHGLLQSLLPAQSLREHPVDF